MQVEDSCDVRVCSMKVKLEVPAQQAMAPSHSLPRSASELADPPSPFSSNPAHHPVSTPTTPSSFGCMSSRPATDSPPSTPSRPRSKPSTPGAAAAAVAAFYATSPWSPRRLMQRAARVFGRSSRHRRLRTFRDAAAGDDQRASSKSPTRRNNKVSDAAAGDERASSKSPTGRRGKVSDAASAVSFVGSPGAATDAELAGGDAHGGAAADIVRQQQQEEEHHPEAVPEKIIHEMKRHAPPVVAGDDEFGAKKTSAAAEVQTTAAAKEEEVESPKKASAAPAPEPEVVSAAGEEVADKFVTVVKEAIRKHEEVQGGEKKTTAARKFQSRVKTAMEARPESEQPRRRDPAPRSNDVIEEARSMLLEKRQCSRVRALVGAFETVMDTNTKDAAAAAGVTPRRHSYRSSA